MNPVQQLLTDNIGLWTGADTAKKSGRGRASGSAGTIYGIRKLRELILELAVRGKLVPQDPNDEPASVLLERIMAEKARLVAEGKIRKDKPMAAITEDEKPFALPQGWEWTRLGEIGTVGSSSRVLLKDWTTTGIPFYRAREIVLLSKNGLVDNDLFISEKLFLDLVAKGVVPEKNDIMITGVGTIGVPYIVTENDRFYFKDASVLIFKNNYSIFTGYLFRFLISPIWNTKIHAESMGTTVHTLTISRANDVLVSLPSLDEQYRIVAKVDELMVLCDQLEAGHVDAADAHEKLVIHLLTTLTASQDSADFNAGWQRIAAHFDMLFTTEASIDALKQTLLQLAVMGKLVPQDPEDEPASALFQRIQAEKARLVSEGKIKKDKPLAAISDDEKPFVLPQGWNWIKLGAIIELISGQHLNPSEYFESPDIGSIPYITGPADFSDIGPVPVRHTFERRSLSFFGDILLTVKGSGVGKINVVFQIELAISRQLMAVRPIIANAKFIEKLLLSMTAIFQDLSVGIAIPGISREHVLYSIIALPPLAEQHRIVAKVDELMALCDRLRERIFDAGALQRNLADAMAAKAVA